MAGADAEIPPPRRKDLQSLRLLVRGRRSSLRLDDDDVVMVMMVVMSVVSESRHRGAQQHNTSQ